ncbi:T9SS type A sorting domain-containing protein [Chryseobacterium sp. NEB161]|nr:T9SS type A sorting domain-containing protein [Chryseobacterium sp. NEB161]
MKKLYTFLIIVCTVFTVNAQTPTTWDGTGWSNGDPQFDIDAIINGNLTLEYDLDTKNLTIASGVTLTLPKDTNLSVFGDVVNNGSIIVESEANFIQKTQTSTYSGSGTATVKRVAHLKKNHFNYWGSPVSGQNLYAFSEGYDQANPPVNPQGTPWYDFYVYDEATDYFVTTGLNSSTVFTPGKGYAIRGKNKYGNTLTEETFTFNGSLNYGNIPITLKRSSGSDKGYNLVANPYPSNINAIQLLNNNNSTNGIVSTLWFWTNINAVTSQQGSGYSGNNYAILNRSGGISATDALNYTATPKPNNYISVAQGFIVQAKTNSSVLQFANTIRVNNSSNFYNKGNVNENDEELLKDRFWLKLISPENMVNTILVAYVDGATNNYDEGYDADLMVVGSDSFYSLLGAHKLQIQGKKPGLDLDDVVPLGNKHYVSGTNKIALDDKNGIFANGQPIYLKDKLTGTVTNLQDKSYSFDSAEGEFTDRFEIIYKTTLAVSENATKNIAIFKDQSDFVIRTKNPVQNVEVYDMSGRMIQSSNIRNNAGTDIRIDHSKLNKGVYVIRVNQDGQIFTQKVIK